MPKTRAAVPPAASASNGMASLIVVAFMIAIRGCPRGFAAREANCAGLRYSSSPMKGLLLSGSPADLAAHRERPARLIASGSKLQRRVINHLLHHEEGAGLPHAGQRDQLVAVDALEVVDVAGADLEEIIEV